MGNISSGRCWEHVISSIHKIPGCPFTVQYSVCIQLPRRSDLHGKGEAARPAGLSERAVEKGLMAASMGSYCKDGGGVVFMVCVCLFPIKEHLFRSTFLLYHLTLEQGRVLFGKR